MANTPSKTKKEPPSTQSKEKQESPEIKRSMIKTNKASDKSSKKIRFGLPRFELKLHDKPVGTIQQKLSLKTKLDLDYYGWSVQGDMLGWNYEIYDQTNTLLAKIQPEHWHLSDHYALHYEQKQDELPLLLLALAIDCIKDTAQH